jgi:hypothetical protein
VLELTVLAPVAIATAWNGHQATMWGDRQSELYGQASPARFQAEAAASRGSPPIRSRTPTLTLLV